eukprot:gene11969-biopygen4304
MPPRAHEVQHEAPAGDHRAVDVHQEDVRPREDAAESVEGRPLDEGQLRVGPVLLVDVLAEGPPVAGDEVTLLPLLEYPQSWCRGVLEVGGNDLQRSEVGLGSSR